MSNAIAIDFGTSRTKLAYLDEATGRPELMRLGHRDDPFIPSLFYLERDSERILLGDEAEAMLERDPSGVINVLKLKLHEAHVRANRRRVTPLELLTRLLSELAERAKREVPALRGQSVKSVHLTVPAFYGPVQAKLLSEAAERAGFTDVTLVPEPAAAARAWLAHANSTADSVVVCDCGGGTVDWAYLRREGGALRLVAECPPGGDRVGGYDLDLELLSLMEDKLNEDALALWHGRQIETLQAVRVIKEGYCRGLPIVPIRIAGREWWLTEADIKRAIAERFVRYACVGLNRFMEQVRSISGANQPPVLLVGGSARLRGLREAIEKDCRCETAWWDRADYATVLGAVPVVTCGTEKSPNDKDRHSSNAHVLSRIIREYACSIDDNEHLKSMIVSLHALADQGDPAAQCRLGELYMEGFGVSISIARAVQLFFDAAEKNYAEAQFRVGEIYEEGKHLPKNLTKATNYFRKAAEQGHSNSQFKLGEMYALSRDYIKAVSWYRKAAEQGHIDAVTRIKLPF